MFKSKYRYFIITALSAYAFLNTVVCDVYTHFNIEVEWYYCLLTIFSITFLTWELNRIVEPVFHRAIKPGRHNLKFISSFFIGGNVITLLSASLVVYVIGTLVHGYGWAQNREPLKLNLIYGVLINLFFHLINTISLFVTEKEKYWKQAEELRKISSQAELQSIKNKINPHFLFNNLNVLSAMVVKDNPDANKFIEEFSRVYRYVLNNEDKEVVPLTTELEFIESYLFLLKKRFTEGLKVELEISSTHLNSYVIPSALQMLIENAIKHNIISSAKPLSIIIHANGDNTIAVINNIQRRQVVENSTKIGLQNIAKRYELVSGKKIEVSENDSRFEVRLPLLTLN